MIEKLIIFVIFSFVKSSTDYPSTMIWDNFLLSLENGKIILPQNKKYFIFDESNYLNEDKNSKRMQKLYQRQKNVYDKNGIANYIFLVDYIDEDVENLEKCAKNINNLISQKFGFSLAESMIILFSMKTKKLRIQPGNSIGSIFSKTICTEMINNLVPYMSSKDYYEAIINFIEDIDYYYYLSKKPSTIIWKKLLNAIENEEIVMPNNKKHFIFDENNYLNEEKFSEKMQALYQKQAYIYANYEIINYIFLVDYIDEEEEDLETCTQTISNLSSKKFGFSLSNSIIILISMETRRLRIQPGNNLDNIFSKSVCTEMINNLGPFMRSGDYYDAMINLIEDIDYYYNQ